MNKNSKSVARSEPSNIKSPRHKNRAGRLCSIGFYLALSAITCAIPAIFADSASGQTNETVWHKNLEDAQKIAAEENKVIVLHFWATWCSPCKNLDKFVFSNPEVQRSLGQDIIAVKVNVDHRADLAKKYRVASIPFEVVITPDGNPVAQRSSPNTADAYLKMLKSFAALSKVSDEIADLTGMATSSKSNESVKTPSEFPGDTALAGGGQFNAGGSFNPASSGNATEPPMFVDDIIKNAQASVRNRLDTSSDALSTEINNNLSTATDRAAEDVADAGQKTFQPVADAQDSLAGKLGDVNRAAAELTSSTSKSIENQFGKPGQQAEGPGLAIDGFCPVTLINKESWEKGDARWGCIHRGKTYLFTSKENRDLFRMAPDAYSPLLAGYDPVFYQEQGDLIAGERKHGAFFGGNEGPKIVVLFKNMETRRKFEAEPAKYIQTVRQAMNETDRDTIYR